MQNYLHFDVAKTFLQAGINVICDKPVTYTLEEARELRKIIKKSKKVFALTHNYTGYPMVKLAKEMVAKGDLGEIIKVVCEYPQGYAITALTGEDKSIANWRANPKVAGVSNCMGDIGTHAENLVHYITGLQIDSLCADLSVNIPGRTLDDDGNVLVRFKGGARGIIYASQVSNGDENDLNIRVYGTKKSSSGIRRIRTISSSRMPVHQGRYIVVVTPTSVEPPPRIRGSRLAIQKDSSRRSPMCTTPQPRRSETRLPVSIRERRVTIFRTLATGSLAWPSSRRL